MNPTSCLLGSRFVWSTNRDLFRQIVLQKCRRVHNCSLDYGSWVEYLRIPTSRNQNQSSAVLWLVFSSNKSVPANRKKEFYTNPGPTKSCQIFESEIKNQKYKAVDVDLFKAYQMVLYSHADPIWPGGTFNSPTKKKTSLLLFGTLISSKIPIIWGNFPKFFNISD